MIDSENLFLPILKSRRKSKEVTEVGEKEYWITIGSDVASYEMEFGLPENTLSEFLKTRDNPSALDLMAEGQALRTLPISKGVVVGLQDERGPEIKLQDDKQNLTFMEGDILSKKTWLALDEWIETNNKFDLIVSRPLGGLAHIPRSNELYYWLLKRVFTLLKPGGKAFLEVPREMGVPAEKMVDQLKEKGFSFSFVKDHVYEDHYRYCIHLDKQEQELELPDILLSSE